MFYTVKEAIEFSNKSQTTIHRLCQKFEGTKHVWKENNKYLVDKELLLEQYPELEERIDAENTEEIKDENIKKSLSDRNLKLTGLNIENEDLKQKLSQREEEISDLKQKLTEQGKGNSNETQKDSEKSVLLAEMLTKKEEELSDLKEKYDNLEKQLLNNSDNLIGNRVKDTDDKDSEIERLNNEIIESHHELAEMTDAVINLQKELSAISRVKEISAISKPATFNPEENLRTQKKAIRYQLTGITISVMVLLSFLFGLYLLTHS